MVNYKNSKILSFGVFNHTYGDENTFLYPTTVSKSVCRAYVLQKYKKKYSNGLLPDDDNDDNDMYNIIHRLKPENIVVYIVEENPTIQNKKQFNEYFYVFRDMLTKPIKDIIQENKPTIQESTLTRYNENIAYLMKRLELDTKNRLFFIDTSNVLNYIKNVSGWSVETKKNYLKCVIAYIPPSIATNYNIYNRELLELINVAQKQRDKNEKTTKQTDKWIDYKDVLERYDQIRQNGLSYDLVVCSFYAGVYFAPYRVMELEHLKIQDINKNVDNFIDFENHTIVLNIYKTSKDYGKRVQYIPDELYEILNQYKKKLLKQNPNAQYLISTNGIKPTHYSICSVLERIFGSSPSLLRNIYITHLNNTGKLQTDEEIKHAAYEMRNSFNVLMSYRKLGD